MRLMAIKTLEHYYITAGHIYDVEEGSSGLILLVNPK